MIDRGKRSVLGVDVDVVDYDGATARIIAAAHSKMPCAVSALAVHGVMTGALDGEHKYRLNRFAVITPDGQPVRWALRLLHGEKLPDRVYGPNLMLKVCELAAQEDLSIFLFGSRGEVISALSERLRRLYPSLRIAGMLPSQFRQGTAEDSAEIDFRITGSGADIVFAGLGCPRQEIFAYEHAERLSRPVIAVGAAFDFHAGLLAQAPAWMQNGGLEWLYRLATEPRRLWRRYILLNPLYCVMTALQAAGALDLVAPVARPPEQQKNFL